MFQSHKITESWMILLTLSSSIRSAMISSLIWFIFVFAATSAACLTYLFSQFTPRLGCACAITVCWLCLQAMWCRRASGWPRPDLCNTNGTSAAKQDGRRYTSGLQMQSERQLIQNEIARLANSLVRLTSNFVDARSAVANLASRVFGGPSVSVRLSVARFAKSHRLISWALRQVPLETPRLQQCVREDN